MNKQIRTVVVLILVLVGLMAVSSGVYAKAPDGDDSPTAQEIIARLENAEDPQQEFAQLSPLEQQAATEALRAATLEVVKVSTTSGVGGASGWREWQLWNQFGNCHWQEHHPQSDVVHVHYAD